MCVSQLQDLSHGFRTTDYTSRSSTAIFPHGQAQSHETWVSRNMVLSALRMRVVISVVITLCRIECCLSMVDAAGHIETDVFESGAVAENARSESMTPDQVR